ncbi:tetratricopeptide repeat protein [Phenylobacterium terrae]|uniref:Tetratricopeptide repeat protein n=1 Tax=Phenylobacterium terrae TaxID=2665495 RepID=A0ABW4N2A4_9CAUL
MPLLIGLSLVMSIALAVHVVRTGQPSYWLWIVLAFQPLGGVVYALAVLLPDVMRGPAARELERAARAKLDPTREYRLAKAAAEDAPTVANQARLAAAAAGLGQHDEAERLYREAAQGIHEDDPALLLGRANALIELQRYDEALAVLEKLGEDAERGRTPAAALALARAHEGLGRIREADSAYSWAAQRLAGFEALGRYAAFMARSGRTAEAKEAIAELDKRLSKTHRQFRKEGRFWRDLAAAELGG